MPHARGTLRAADHQQTAARKKEESMGGGLKGEVRRKITQTDCLVLSRGAQHCTIHAADAVNVNEQRKGRRYDVPDPISVQIMRGQL